ncbi:MAG: hypothetical protein R2715_22350 [Ilumatobacteraceae bacterium]
MHSLRRRGHPGERGRRTRGGLTAGSVDFAPYMAGRMALLIGVVLLLSFVLLMAVF